MDFPDDRKLLGSLALHPRKLETQWNTLEKYTKTTHIYRQPDHSTPWRSNLNALAAWQWTQKTEKWESKRK